MRDARYEIVRTWFSRSIYIEIVESSFPGSFAYGVPKRMRYSLELTNPLTIVRKSPGCVFK
jgi:hypothetical protein